MSKLRVLKRVLAFTLALSLCIGILGNDSDADVYVSADSESYDVSEYAEKLQSIAEEQAKLDEQIKSAEKDIEDKEKEQDLIKKKIDTVNNKIEVLNSYMTRLELDMSSNQRLIDDKQREIEDGVESLKKRIRAMYLAGDDTYTSIILESGSFYDVLMRLELIKRVAEHDNTLIDGLISAKEDYEKARDNLNSQKSEYDKQYEELENQKKELDELYNSSKQQKEAYEKQKAELEKKNEEYIKERQAFEADLSGILSGTYGNSSGETARAAAELSANEALRILRNGISERISNGEVIPDSECRYEFGWPVPGNYYISSGVGERWGSYHTGMDIAGGSGTNIHAAESGIVIRTNSSCPHNYGKNSSCGCGGGYGNYIIIDHGEGFISLYGHLTSLNVKDGDTVKKGDIIGTMGSTGYSTGDHLHFEIRYQGMYLNPASYVNLS
ncbi:MAG: peptidoglycan DD-metalloendopeptidase family protein [Ruminococcus sp.]|nr:peptidoglycan DD-metalloendopeptidase family protein [Ruminococcus sp.]